MSDNVVEMESTSGTSDFDADSPPMSPLFQCDTFIPSAPQAGLAPQPWLSGVSGIAELTAHHQTETETVPLSNTENTGLSHLHIAVLTPKGSQESDIELSLDRSGLPERAQDLIKAELNTLKQVNKAVSSVKSTLNRMRYMDKPSRRLLVREAYARTDCRKPASIEWVVFKVLNEYHSSFSQGRVWKW